MNITELESALDLQKRAYALLLWTGKEARRLLADESLSSSAKCADWLKRHLNEFPVELRPGADEFDGFAKMLTSFFNTSFHLEGAGGNVRLIRGRKFKDGRNKKYAQGRAAEVAEELTRVAIASLAKEEGVRLEGDLIANILKDDALTAQVSLWAYGCELVRRSQFASQGSAVHHLWLELDEKKRRGLNAEAIWKARSALVEALKKKAAQYDQQ
jgi:hypothetical protein